jgi:acyl carrier protein
MEERVFMEISEIKTTVRNYILKEFLPGENPAALGESTPLVTGGILDSLATLKLVSFLENTYGITFEAHEVDAEHLDTIAAIANVVMERKSAT